MQSQVQLCVLYCCSIMDLFEVVLYQAMMTILVSSEISYKKFIKEKSILQKRSLYILHHKPPKKNKNNLKTLLVSLTQL